MTDNAAENRNKAFSEIYNQHKDCVFRTCYMLLKDYQLAEDAAQETFYKVYCKLHTFKGKSNLKTWITKVSVNICRDKLKKKSYTEQPHALIEAASASVGDEIENRLTVVKAITDLPVELREVIILYYYHELKQKEMAEILKIPSTTVAYRLKKAKETLKTNIKEDFYE